MSLGLIASIFGIFFGLMVLMLGLLTPLKSIPFSALGIGIIYLSIKGARRFDGRS